MGIYDSLHHLDFLHYILAKAGDYQVSLLLTVCLYLALNHNIASIIFINILLSSTVNTWMKLLWKTPLPTTLQKAGWSFPSGHTQMFTVLWICLAIHFNKWWVYLLSFIFLFLMADSIVYFCFHNWYEIMGGFSTAGLIIAFYYCVHDIIEQDEKFLLTFGSVIVMIQIMLSFLILTETPNYTWVWEMVGINTGILLGTRLSMLGSRQVSAPSSSTTQITNILINILIFIIPVLIYGFISSAAATYKSSLPCLSAGLLLGLWISWTARRLNIARWAQKGCQSFH